MAEGRYLEGRVERRVEEEEDHIDRSFHGTVLLGKLRQEVRRATNRERGGVVFSRRTSAQTPGEQLQMSSGRNTQTWVYPLCKTS